MEQSNDDELPVYEVKFISEQELNEYEFCVWLDWYTYRELNWG